MAIELEPSASTNGRCRYSGARPLLKPRYMTALVLQGEPNLSFIYYLRKALRAGSRTALGSLVRTDFGSPDQRSKSLPTFPTRREVLGTQPKPPVSAGLRQTLNLSE